MIRREKPPSRLYYTLMDLPKLSHIHAGLAWVVLDRLAIHPQRRVGVPLNLQVVGHLLIAGSSSFEEQ
jgi:hypothetical protein